MTSTYRGMPRPTSTVRPAVFGLAMAFRAVLGAVAAVAVVAIVLASTTAADVRDRVTFDDPPTSTSTTVPVVGSADLSIDPSMVDPCADVCRGA